jgi:hypothetical protein
MAALDQGGGGFPGRPGRFGFIAVFPETVPRTDRRAALWEGLTALLAPGGFAVISLPSSEADRFDRKKPPGFRRLGDLKRNGFRALAYEKQRGEPVLKSGSPAADNEPQVHAAGQVQQRTNFLF